MLLCLSSVDFGVLEEAVDLAGDVAFEAALGFSGGFAFGGSFGDVGLGVGVGAENCVVAGQAAFRYSLMSPPQRAVFTTWRCLSEPARERGERGG